MGCRSSIVDTDILRRFLFFVFRISSRSWGISNGFAINSLASTSCISSFIIACMAPLASRSPIFGSILDKG